MYPQKSSTCASGMFGSDHYPLSPSSVDLLNMAHGLGFPTSTTSSPSTQEDPFEDGLRYDPEGASHLTSKDSSSEGTASTGSWLERGSLGTPRARSSPLRGFSATKLANEYPSPIDEVPHSCSSAIPPFRPPGRKVPLTRAPPTPEAAALLHAQPALFDSVERFCLRNGFDACDLRAPATLVDSPVRTSKIGKASTLGKKTSSSRPRRAAQRGPFWWHTEMTPLNYARHARESPVVAYLEALGLDAHNLNDAKPRALEGEHEEPPRHWNLMAGPSPPTAVAPPARRPICRRTTNKAAAQWAAAKCQAAAAERKELMKKKVEANEGSCSSVERDRKEGFCTTVEAGSTSKLNSSEAAQNRKNDDDEEWGGESNDESEVMLVEPYLDEQCPSGQPLRTGVALPAGTTEGSSKTTREVDVDQLMDSVYHLQALPTEAKCDAQGANTQATNDRADCMLPEECWLESGELPKEVHCQHRAQPTGSSGKNEADLNRQKDIHLGREGLERSSTITSVADFENEFGNSSAATLSTSRSEDKIPVASERPKRTRKFTCHLTSDIQHTKAKAIVHNASWSSECPEWSSSVGDDDKRPLVPAAKTAPGTPVSAASVAATLSAEVAERNALRRARKKRAMNFAEGTTTSDTAVEPPPMDGSAVLLPLQHDNQCASNERREEEASNQTRNAKLREAAPLLLFEPSDFEDSNLCFAQQGNDENEKPLTGNCGEVGDASEDPPLKRQKTTVMTENRQGQRGVLLNSSRGGAAGGSLIRWCALA